MSARPSATIRGLRPRTLVRTWIARVALAVCSWSLRQFHVADAAQNWNAWEP